MKTDQLADVIYSTLLTHSGESPFIGEREGAGTTDDQVLVDGRVSLHMLAEKILWAIEEDEDEVRVNPANGFGCVISELRFKFLLDIVRKLSLAHGAGYNQEADQSYLRIDHNEMHMLFYVHGVDAVDV